MGHFRAARCIACPEVIGVSYRIVYGPMPKGEYQAKKRNTLRIRFLTALFLLLFAFLVKYTWTEGTKTLQSLMIPGDGCVTQAAFEELTTNLMDGQPIGEAVTAFCRQVIDGAEALD